MTLLGIDVGTTGCKVIALATDGVIRAAAQREYDVVRPQPGWAELDSRAVPGSDCPTLTSTGVPGGVCASALDNRLVTTCRSRASSPRTVVGRMDCPGSPVRRMPAVVW